jgi:hypothetical protein
MVRTLSTKDFTVLKRECMVGHKALQANATDAGRATKIDWRALKVWFTETEVLFEFWKSSDSSAPGSVRRTCQPTILSDWGLDDHSSKPGAVGLV